MRWEAERGGEGGGVRAWSRQPSCCTPRGWARSVGGARLSGSFWHVGSTQRDVPDESARVDSSSTRKRRRRETADRRSGSRRCKEKEAVQVSARNSARGSKASVMWGGGHRWVPTYPPPSGVVWCATPVGEPSMQMTRV
jgi:hypothetical protein